MSQLISKWKFWKTRRYVVALTVFLGFFTAQMMTLDLNELLLRQNNNDTMARLALDSHFYGLPWTQISGGWLGWRFGGRRVFCLAIIVAALATLITPVTVSQTPGYYCLMALRIVIGLALGVTYPSAVAIWSKWAPKVERSRMLTFGFSGVYFAPAVIFPMVVYLSDRCEWFVVFYVSGAIGLIWSVIWLYFISEEPERDKWISENELTLLKGSLGAGHTDGVCLHWKAIFLSIPVWALSAAHFCENWGFYTYTIEMNRLMKETRGYDKFESDRLLCSTLLLMSCAMLSAGRLTDWLSNSRMMSATNIRKLFICLGSTLQALFILLGTCSMTTVKLETCLLLTMALGSFVSAAINGNHIDLGVEHASVLMGITNTFGTLPAILTPIVTEYMTTNKTIDEWRIVLDIAAGVYLFGALCFGAFGSGNNQNWCSEHAVDTNVKPREGIEQF